MKSSMDQISAREMMDQVFIIVGLRKWHCISVFLIIRHCPFSHGIY
jgi:hypothetical protein